MVDNFNLRFSENAQSVRAARHRLCGKNIVTFDNLVPFVVETVLRSDTEHIVGCVAWLTHADILNALAKKKTCKIVVTNDTFSKRTLTLYKKCKGFKCLGRKKGRRRPYMHHKFLIGLDAKRRPLWMLNGSFNFSYHATQCLENVTLTDSKDAKVVKLFHREFTRIYKLARAVSFRKLKKKKRLTK